MPHRRTRRLRYPHPRSDVPAVRVLRARNRGMVGRPSCTSTERSSGRREGHQTLGRRCGLFLSTVEAAPLGRCSPPFKSWVQLVATSGTPCSLRTSSHRREYRASFNGNSRGDRRLSAAQLEGMLIASRMVFRDVPAPSTYVDGLRRDAEAHLQDLMTSERARFHVRSAVLFGNAPTRRFAVFSATSEPWPSLESMDVELLHRPSGRRARRKRRMRIRLGR
jgi:hypothetical protein